MNKRIDVEVRVSIFYKTHIIWIVCYKRLWYDEFREFISGVR